MCCVCRCYVFVGDNCLSIGGCLFDTNRRLSALAKQKTKQTYFQLNLRRLSVRFRKTTIPTLDICGSASKCMKLCGYALTGTFVTLS